MQGLCWKYGCMALWVLHRRCSAVVCGVWSKLSQSEASKLSNGWNEGIDDVLSCFPISLTTWLYLLWVAWKQHVLDLCRVASTRTHPFLRHFSSKQDRTRYAKQIQKYKKQHESLKSQEINGIVAVVSFLFSFPESQIPEVSGLGEAIKVQREEMHPFIA